jgi:hypothetical protein
MRATVSTGPPAANGTTIVIARAGNVCAVATPATASTAIRVETIAVTARIDVVMLSSALQGLN